VQLAQILTVIFYTLTQRSLGAPSMLIFAAKSSHATARFVKIYIKPAKNRIGNARFYYFFKKTSAFPLPYP